MHDTAFAIGSEFFKVYGAAWRTVIELGSLDINGSLRSASPDSTIYLGLDVEHGKSVDLVVRVGEPIPFRDDFADAVISSSQLEHDDFFWETFLEFTRVVRPGGYVYINAPSNGLYHRHPNDNWRFFPDCGHVLVRWAKKNGQDVELVESFVADRRGDVWNDFVGVFRVGPCDDPIPSQQLCDLFPCRNVWRLGASKPELEARETEDISTILKLRATQNRASGNAGAA